MFHHLMNFVFLPFAFPPPLFPSISAYIRYPRPEEESGGSCFESDSGPEENGCPVEVSLTLSKLESLHATSSEPVCRSQHSKNGMSVKRIKAVVRNPGCACQCWVPEQLLVKICHCFSMLTKVGQDALLWSMQAEGGKRRKFWNIEGLQVC